MKSKSKIKIYTDRELEPAQFIPEERSWSNMKTLLDRRSLVLTKQTVLNKITYFLSAFVICIFPFTSDFDILMGRAAELRSNPTIEERQELKMAENISMNSSFNSDMLIDVPIKEERAKTFKESEAISITKNKEDKGNDLKDQEKGGIDHLPSLFDRSDEHLASESPGKELSRKEEMSIFQVAPLETDSTESPPVAKPVLNPELQEEEFSSGEQPETLQEVIKNGESQEKSVEVKDVLSRMQLMVYAGPQFSRRDVSGPNDVFVNKMNEYESQQTSIEAGLNLAYKIKPEITLQSGFGFYRIRENMVYPDNIDTAFNTTTSGIWEYIDKSFWKYTDSIRDNMNPTQWIHTDSILVTISDSIYKEYTDTVVSLNREKGYSGQRLVNYVEIPFLVGYEKRIARLGLGVQAGFSIGYLISSSGPLINSNGKEISATNGAIHRDWVFNALAGASIDYYLTDQLSIGLQPAIRLPLGTSLEYENYNWRYTTYSIRLRVKYLF